MVPNFILIKKKKINIHKCLSFHHFILKFYILYRLDLLHIGGTINDFLVITTIVDIKLNGQLRNL